jgi:general secretion pathway protein E
MAADGRSSRGAGARTGAGIGAETAPGDLPFAFAHDRGVILNGDLLICGPSATAETLCEVRRHAGRALRVLEVGETRFQGELDSHYTALRSGADETAQDEIAFDLGSSDRPGRQQDLLDDTSEAPVIELVNQLLRRAVRAGASDLHVEPMRDGLQARIRVDGMLRKVLDRDDVPVRRVVSRLKVMAGLDTSETRLPQDGRIALRFGGRAVDVRFSSLPGPHGERLVLRILDRQAVLHSLDDLGLNAAQKAVLQRLALRPDGIVLATGPTGSGKTTTLYSLLQLIDRAGSNIVTVEDPIEYELPGVSQTQVDPDIGLTFAAGLRATLRQDPDVILLGEIRDGETARIAIQAALTGHMVLSSLHANGTMGAVTRLRDLGLEDYLIGSTLRGVLAQRLLRRLCPECRVREPASPAIAAAFARAGLAEPATLWRAKGCAACGETGYNGRIGVFELVAITPEVAAAITAGAHEGDLQRMALDDSQTMLAATLARLAAGETSADEITRIMGDL